MVYLWHCATLIVASYITHTLAEVQVSGFAKTGSAPRKLTIPGKTTDHALLHQVCLRHLSLTGLHVDRCRLA